MRLVNITSGSAFKVALQLLAVFAIMLLIAGSLLITAVTNTLEAETRAQLEEETLLLEDIYDAEGTEGLVRSIQELSKQSLLFDRALGLFDENKLHLAGKISLVPDYIGWGKTRLSMFTLTSGKQPKLPLKEPSLQQEQPDTSGQGQTYHARVYQLDKLTLVVGRSTKHIDAARDQLTLWLLVTGVGLALGILLLGYLASRRSYRKLDGMGAVLKQVANGEMNARIQVPAAEHDQIDQIAVQMNTQLDHLAILVQGIQTTATAIAHDLKTPLSHAQIALYEAGDKCERGEDPEQDIAQALDKLEQLNQTFDTILRISRIQAHTDRSSFAVAELSDLLEKIHDLLEPAAQEAGMQLKSDLPENSLSLLCDAGMIQQLLINLLNNAINHCPEGSEIHLGAAQKDQSVVLTVTDNGPGIPADERDNIFKPFFRLSQSRTTPGNGLGLALVKAIADAHQADIQLSDTAPGLRVQITFPKL